MKPPADYQALAALEWLETNGLGGYASGTVSGAATRGYHGLLAAALRGPSTRTLTVTTCDEWLAQDPPVFLSSHQYPGVVSPDGYRRIASFTAEPFPAWTWLAAGRRVERRVFMVHGENTTVVRYALIEGGAARLAVRPFFVFRDHHARRVASDDWRVVATRSGAVVRCAPSDGGAALFLHIGDASYRDDPLWYRNFEYQRERERGLADREDAFAPFVLELPLEQGTPADLVFTTEAHAGGHADLLESAERARRTAIVAPVAGDDPPGRRLAAAADAFVTARGGEDAAVIAGYPWFGVWARDTMISLPGLTLATSRTETAARILTAFAGQLRDGLLPNRLAGGTSAPEYNTVDASLWFTVALHHFLASLGDAAPADGAPGAALEKIVLAYSTGTRYGIREDGDGLVTAGTDGVALTWMDARVNGRPVTPRHGKAVEVNALWYNARRILAGIQARQGRSREAAETERLAERTRAAFLRSFWDETSGSMHDLIAPDGAPEAGIRPNQLFAASLPFPLISRAQAARMLGLVEAQLLTPVGLRTLAPGDPAYRGRYEGGPESRDAAYHQGTVWPWLLGAYVDASLYAGGRAAGARRRLRGVLDGVLGHLDTGCVGQLPEIFDGDAPHEARGCPAQAWSVAEVRRARGRLRGAPPLPDPAG